MATQPSRCKEYSSDSWCNVKRLRDMSLEIGAWGCAPWIVLWPILVWIAPVPNRLKPRIMGVYLGYLVLFLLTFLNQANLRGITMASQPVLASLLLLYYISLLGLIILGFVLSYRGLSQEIARRNALHDYLGEAAWRRLYYCTVHDNIIDPLDE